MKNQQPLTRLGLGDPILPHTRSGWWAVVLTAAESLSLLLVYISIASGRLASSAAPAIAVPAALSLVFGLSSAVLGIVSINVKRDRSILVLVAVALSLAYVCSWPLTFVH